MSIARKRKATPNIVSTVDPARRPLFIADRSFPKRVAHPGTTAAQQRQAIEILVRAAVTNSEDMPLHSDVIGELVGLKQGEPEWGELVAELLIQLASAAMAPAAFIEVLRHYILVAQDDIKGGHK
jgi:hypothetical protein